MKALTLSTYLIAKSNLAGDGLTNKKLQKLLYYVKAWGLVYFEDGIIDDDFQAWVHGPVCPEVYNAYKSYKFSLIQSDMSEETACKIVNSFGAENHLNQDKLDLIDSVFDKYGQMTSLQLELLTHQEDPWKEARKGLSPTDTSNRIISPVTMKRYYGQSVG